MGLLVPITPYVPLNSVSVHLNGTILTPGGLPATDMSFFLDPYPIEGTAYGVGVGTGTNALNNDPSRTLFVMNNVPGFTPQSTWSNTNTATMAGVVQGTSDMTQCKSTMTTFSTVNPADIVPGVRVYQMYYNLTGSAGYNVQATLNLVTDGTVNVDQLGNYYYTVAAITSGARQYYASNGTLLSNTTINGLLPLCRALPPRI